MENKRRFSPIRMPAKSDKLINISILILMIFGFIMVTNASMGIAVGNNEYLLRTVIKQLAFSIAGYIAMIFMAKQINLKIIKDNIILIMFLTTVFLLMTLGFSATGGARAWIKIPLPGIEVTIQPSEFAKISTMAFIAVYMGDVTKRVKKPIDLIKAPLFISALFFFIVAVLQSDLGSGVVILAIAFFCFLIPKHPQLRRTQRILLFLFFAGLVVTSLLLFSPLGETFVKLLPLQGYQKNRILSAINPFVDRYESGYQLINGLVSFASGGFFGIGFGNSVRKYTNFPAANTDFILAIVVEELGFLGFLIIFIPYIIIIVRLFRYAFKMRSEKGQIILVGTAMYILIHMLFNVGGVTGLIPLTGVPLLMISAGGSSTLSLMMAIGLSQSIITQYEEGVIQ